MRKLILCEGKTDAILLSYYLGKVCGWNYTKKAPKELDIKADGLKGETSNWYEKGEDQLLICAVGSKTGFKNFYSSKIHAPLFSSSAFEKIAIILDRDDDKIEEIEQQIENDLCDILHNVKNNQWVECQYVNDYKETRTLKFLLRIIPNKNEGALETLLLDAISENEYDKIIVDRSKIFVDEIEPYAERYISKHRLKVKAYLGVTWAIQSPQKVFDFIDEQIKQMQWERYDILKECFEKLIEI